MYEFYDASIKGQLLSEVPHC